MDKHAFFIEAVRNRFIVQLHYENLSRPAMLVEPYAYGLKDEVATVFAWDRSFSEWEWDSGWRWLRLDLILNPGRHGGVFSAGRRGYRHDNNHMQTIYAQL